MSFGGFGAKPAAGATGFGTGPAAGGGFGSTAPATGGFGSTAPAGGGFGSAAPAAGAGGFGAKPAATTATTGSGFGFGGAAAPAGGGGFGSSAAAAPAAGVGFGSAACGGFGGKPMTTLTPFGASAGGGGFSAPTASTGFGTAAGSTGFGAGRGGFGLGGGFGGLGTAAPAGAANTAPTAAQFPYPGIKGPGNAMSWTREVDFSQVTEQTTFESLPQPLQQHLMELRSFMHAERDATKKVYEYLNESDKPVSASGSASAGKGTAVEASAVSYRSLLSKLAVLKGGGNRAVDIVAVQCNQHEGQARRQLQRLEKLEASVRDYERYVWEPLLEQGLPLSNSSSAAGLRGGSYRPALSSDSTSPFVALVEELSRRMECVNDELTSLEATLVPPGRPLRGRGANDRPGHRGSSAATPCDAIAQINASLLHELNQLRDFSCVAAHLHSRTDTARELFTRRYGQAEADVLFTDTEAQRNGMALFRRASASSYFDIPPLPQPNPPPAAPAASAGFAAPAATSTVSGFGTKPATATTTATVGGFGVAPASTGGFGAASPTAAGAATAGGFGAKPATASVGAGGSSGFGFGVPTSAAPATAGFGAPAASTVPFAAPAGVFGAPASTAAAPAAPAMGPASPAAAPTAFSLGGPAMGAVGFGTGPGTSAADGGDRPARRAR